MGIERSPGAATIEIESRPNELTRVLNGMLTRTRHPSRHCGKAIEPRHLGLGKRRGQ